MERLKEMEYLFEDDTLEKYTNRKVVIAEQKNILATQKRLRNLEYGFVSHTTTTSGRPQVSFPSSFPGWKFLLPSNRVTIQNLKENNDEHLYGKYFLCRNVTPPFIMTGMMTIVEDPEGVSAIRLALYNYTSCGMFDDLTKVIPIGTILVIKNPWFKSTMDGGYTLRCDNPRDVLTMEEVTYGELFPDLVWKGSIPPEYIRLQLQSKTIPKNVKELKEDNSASETSQLRNIGNKYFVNGQYKEALQSYNSCLTLLKNMTDDLDLLGNRAAVYLKFAWFSLALEDTEMVLKKDPCHIKAIYRKFKALCGLNCFDKALKFLKDQLPRFSKNSEGYKLISGEIEKTPSIRKQLAGGYNMLEIIEKSKNNVRLEDILEYQGPIEVSPNIKNKGRGVIATKEIKAGELVMASRAFEVAFPKRTQLNSFTTEIESSEKQIVYTLDQMQLYSLISQRLSHEPKSAKELFSLYAGTDKGYLELDEISEDKIDLKRIHSILNYNSFKFTANEQATHFDNSSDLATGLWILPALINHSCFDYNAWHTAHGDFMFIRAVTNIAKGEEILINYISPLKSFKERSAMLETNYGFSCTCRQCSLNRIESAENTEKLGKIMDRLKKMQNAKIDLENIKWIEESIAFVKSIRTDDAEENLNIELADLHEYLAHLYFMNGDPKGSIEELKKTYSILGNSSLVHQTCTVVFNIITVYLFQSGKQNLRRVRQWIPKIKALFMIAHGTLDVLRSKKAWRQDQNFENLLKENGIDL